MDTSLELQTIELNRTMDTSFPPRSGFSDDKQIRRCGSDESRLSIGQKNWSLFQKKTDPSFCELVEDDSDVFSISSFDSEIIEGSLLKVLYDVEEDIITIKKVLAEGWIYKKGSGHDFMCSRRWKSRWAELAIVKLPNYDIDIPCFLMYWHPSSAIPTSFIPLDGANVESFSDIDSKSHWHRFKIYPKDSMYDEDCRIFSTNQDQASEWVHIINVAIRDHQTKKYANLNIRKLRVEETDGRAALLMDASQLCSNMKVRYMVAKE